MTLRLTDKDKAVIDAFLNRKMLDSKKLWTDGNSLDGRWMGGSNLASWRNDGTLYLPTPSTKGRVTINNYIEKRMR